MIPALEKIDRMGGLFGLFFSRPRYRTLEPVELDGEIIPAGYITDLVSAPWWAREFLPLQHLKLPALKHDMRRTLQTIKPLEEIDKQFYDEMLEAGISKILSFILWKLVRLNNVR